MKDIDIRKALFEGALKQHQNEPDTRIVEELGLNHGQARIDVAVVNGVIHGFEIKSQKDTLDRLPLQLPVYSSSLDYVTLVVHESHVKKACDIIPRWWGVQVVKGSAENVTFHKRRSSKPNPAINLLYLLRLLWRSEAYQILVEAGITRGYKSKSKELIYDKILKTLAPDDVGAKVRSALKQRENWRDNLTPHVQAHSLPRSVSLQK